MSRIDELIKKHSPSGVDYKTLGSVAEVFRGKRFVKADMVSSGVPCIHYGEIYTRYGLSATESYSFLEPNRAANLRYALPGDLVVATAGETIQDIGNAVAWLGAGPVVIHDACYAVRSVELDAGFLSHLFRSTEFKDQIRKWVSSAKISSISTQNLARAVVPVPPLEVQREIVRTLDAFKDLEAELEAELTARRRQYAHYRRALLAGGDARWVSLGDVGRVAMCKRVFKHQTSPNGDIPFFKIGTFGGRPDAFIARDLYDEYRAKYSFPKQGDILISAAGTIGRAIPYDGGPAYFQDSNIVWIENDEELVLNSFLKHWYSVVEWPVTDGGTIKRLYNDDIRRAKIAVPPLGEQRRIVANLDKFDLLVNDLSSGLPAEVEARRQQYAYYRDRLLKFEEAAA